MRIIEDSREPAFASNEARGETDKRYVMYYDMDGMIACCNFIPYQNYRQCIICRNCCMQYVAHDDGTYTCSACGKFPRELLQG